METETIEKTILKEKIKEEFKFEKPKDYRVILKNNSETYNLAVLKVLMDVFTKGDKKKAMDMMYHAHIKGFAQCMISTKTLCEEKKKEAEDYCSSMEEIEPEIFDPMWRRSFKSHYTKLEFEVESVDSENND